ncbi:MAG: hypothetical protein IH984_15705 [Planctomycetes bacterium]|nr:hypothetical protein [Planctomycetota bacterium]
MLSRRVIKVTALIFVTSGLTGCSEDSSSPTPLTAMEIVEHMLQAYANCETYQDKGLTKTSMYGTTKTIKFETAFIRPNKFRLDLRIEGTTPTENYSYRFVVYANEEGAFSWSDDEKFAELTGPDESLSMALAGVATGVSDAPALLLPNTIGAEIFNDSADMSNLSRGDDTTIDGFPCYHVKGDTEVGSIWLDIDKQTFLIRRQQESMLDNEIQRITEYTPEIGISVDDKNFSGPE